MHFMMFFFWELTVFLILLFAIYLCFSIYILSISVLATMCLL